MAKPNDGFTMHSDEQLITEGVRQKSAEPSDKTEQPSYGPFHRVRSPTQSDETCQKQIASQEIWGRPRRGSDIPQVQSYTGPLAEGEKGIEFYTAVKPDQGLPPGQARWIGPRPGVTVKDDFARIPVVITKVMQNIVGEAMEAVAEEAVAEEATEAAVEEEEELIAA